MEHPSESRLNRFWKVQTGLDVDEMVGRLAEQIFIFFGSQRMNITFMTKSNHILRQNSLNYWNAC